MGDFLQYVELNSYLHRLDPRTKFVFFIIMSVLTSFVKSGVALLFLFVVFLAIWLSGRIGKYMLVLLNKVKVLLLFIFLLWLVLGAFTVNEGPTIYRAAFSIFGNPYVFSLDWFDFYKGAVYSLRIFLMISAFYTVILTTNFSQIILGLQSWKVPYAVAFGVGLVFQIIPMIVQEFATIMEAQKSRGLEVDKCSALAKMKNYVIVSLPLLFRVLSKGHSISLAMHYYKLNFKVKRTSYKMIKATYSDAFFASVTAIATVVTIILQVNYYIQI
ncbi:energy-coupling factor transporter transmembrane component T family protein [Sporolactobacillus laevolacticus]|uniref:energy-coupling factor transporter transmembrane component T family protein n=1 Tax=Sporolactobacillus laevolacticus TaxID=33018 RepID=UPI0025B542AB|nr:energy-coupling factor transporter transmembrane component T [Sporolactobacillus laevolacticus]MDN3956022.1 energy-coupling factor transporter transmembrane component T [Sporolactobacillus laevolacticus]